ncbi:MAG: cupin domain-containing protein [Candidatus Eremiobacteraeota bacterium]|nr:cupin domain-containing protein [Candidatus Eremiobacteraeota bacterium]
MIDTNVIVKAGTAPRGSAGQLNLARGERTALRMWDHEAPGEPKPASTRTYETVGYVIDGRAELHLGATIVALAEGDSWVVPAGASHTYRILETFTAIEATSPPDDAAA